MTNQEVVASEPARTGPSTTDGGSRTAVASPTGRHPVHFCRRNPGHEGGRAMATYVLRRIIQAIPIMFGISLLIFLIVQLAPGSPVDRFRNPRVAPEQLEALMRLYGLDKPLLRAVLQVDHGVLPGLATRRVGLFVHRRPAGPATTSSTASRPRCC